MNQWNKKWLRQFWIGMGIYSISCFVVPFALNAIGRSPLAYLVAILPVLPFCYIMYVTVQNIRSMDELERTIQLEALVYTIMSTAIITFTYGWLEIAQLAPHIPSFVIAILMIVIWGIANNVIRRRYM